jgi:hypothetical protein
MVRRSALGRRGRDYRWQAAARLRDWYRYAEHASGVGLADANNRVWGQRKMEGHSNEIKAIRRFMEALS